MSPILACVFFLFIPRLASEICCRGWDLRNGHLDHISWAYRIFCSLSYVAIL